MRSETFTFGFFSFLAFIFSFSNLTFGDSQANLLNKNCIWYIDAPYDKKSDTSLAVLTSNLNDTLSDLRSKLTSSHFATARRPNVYALFQCRDYLSTSDCLSCFSSAQSEVHLKCPSSGVVIIYFDGCFLRYEGEDFFDEATEPGNAGFCGNRTVAHWSGFNLTVEMLLRDLVAATPRSPGYFAAAKREGVGGGDGAIVYGVAQCTHTVSESGCRKCLETASGNVEQCLPNTEGRAVDVGCFLRYSDTAFFGDDKITDVAALSREKGQYAAALSNMDLLTTNAMI